jgi:hypothetical protein
MSRFLGKLFRRHKPRQSRILGLGDEVTSIQSQRVYLQVSEQEPTSEQLEESEQMMKERIGPAYKIYRDEEGRTDLPAMFADSPGPVFGWWAIL